MRRTLPFATLLLFASSLQAQTSRQSTTTAQVFAPTPSSLVSQQEPYRTELCLSGVWAFQPVAVSPAFVRDRGQPPELPAPSPDKWDATPLKVPSPWNVNTWGNGRDVGVGTPHPYWPDSVYFPSYPASWDTAEMGWVRRSFPTPAKQKQDDRVLLHFDAVAGDCQGFVNGKLAGTQGKLAGTHFDKYLPFDLDVTDLLHPSGQNEILLGIRAHALFNLRSETYPRMRTPYPCGSDTEHLVGPWQDIYLRTVPAVRVADTFVQPKVHEKELKLVVTLHNDTPQRQRTSVRANIWQRTSSLSPKDNAFPEAASQLLETYVHFDAADVEVEPDSSREVTLTRAIGPGELQLWTPNSPTLYAAVVELRGGEQSLPVDVQVARFGWRQFTLAGQDLLLNGQKIQLTGDLLHPFGPFISSPRYAWAWYRMIKDMGGNAVRLHAQPHPSHFLDLADEMGLIVLDETALFGSSVALNFEPEIAWKRFEEHYDSLILRDRNHPSVLGWSFGNELFAIFNLNNIAKEDADRWYARLAELGLRARKLDPTRAWISCDGDEDLRGTLPVYSKHFGLGLPDAGRLPDVGKPLMVGESGGSYYARPNQLTEFNGVRAFGSYIDRNEALGIDVFQNLTKLAKPRLAYYSASETAWFGIEHLPLGYHDHTRLPTLADGVFFTSPFRDNTPGMQIERMPPYVTTFNPGWDTTLPLYKPLGMFDAQKAALTGDAAAARKWAATKPRGLIGSAFATSLVRSAEFRGDPHSPLARRIKELGLPLSAKSDAPLLVVDLDSASPEMIAAALAEIGPGRKAVLIAQKPLRPEIAKALPWPVTVTSRTATALRVRGNDPFFKSLSDPALYFAEERDPVILTHTLETSAGTALLEASNTEWALFNNAPERAKCAAVLMDEQLIKPAAAALIRLAAPAGGEVTLTTLRYDNTARPAVDLWRRLFTGLGLTLGEFHPASVPAIQKDIVSALLIRTQAGNDAFPIDPSPRAGSNGWSLAQTADRFNFPRTSAHTQLSFWVNAPRATDDLLTAGPDAPRFGLIAYAFKDCALYLNGQVIPPTRTEPADYRTLSHFGNLPLKQGWNHILLDIESPVSTSGEPTAALRIHCTSDTFLRDLDSAVEAPADVRAAGGK